MSTNWTEQQLKAMEPADRLTVLSAAAGSGKTAVLVERVLRLLMDEENKVNAEKMIIVTFTNAAAAEFRERIEKAINRQIALDPGNSYLKAQKINLKKADISTIHSLCSKLIRENFNVLSIEPDFEVYDEYSARFMHKQAISFAMEHGYSVLGRDFKQLVSFMGKSSDDNEIRRILYEMNRFFSALPNPAALAAEMAADYGKDDYKQTAAYEYLKKDLLLKGETLVAIVQQIEDIVRLGKFTGYENSTILLKKHAGDLFDRIKNEDYANSDRLIKSLPKNVGRTSNECKESLRIKDGLRVLYKDIVADISKTISFFNRDMYKQHTDATKKYVDVLFNVYIKYTEYLMDIKMERKIFEFYDLEHFTLQLLQDKKGNPTALAESLRENYEYIMEDEFQDTSYVQDAIFTMLAKEGQKNLYVVGDVKQSIYGFRKASPRIFLDKRQIGVDDPAKGNTIFLTHNFRSRYGVISGVNHIFRRLMTKDCGGVDYAGNEELTTTASPDNDIGVVFKICDKNSEIEYVAATIRSMIDSGYTITDKNGPRPVKPEDFCILMRSKAKFEKYKARLENYGLDVFMKEEDILFTKPEIRNILNLLRVLANPTQEIYLTATMFGDLFEFDLDKILGYRLVDIKENLYKALALSPTPQAEAFLKTLGDLSYLAGIYSPDKLIDHLCKTTNYYNKTAFSKDGVRKRENLRWFVDFAKKWAKTHPSNLSAFLRWVDICTENNVTAKLEGGKAANAVTIMTMHGSKGLQFPVVFVADLGKRFSTDSLQARFFTDVELGAGMFANTGFGYNSSTLVTHAIKTKIKQNNANEELRLLYVAFTRSQNLLFITGEITKKLTETIAATAHKKVFPVWMQKAAYPMAWIYAALINHPDILPEYGYIPRDYSISNCIKIGGLPELSEVAPMTSEPDASVEIKADLDKIKSNMSFVYPHSARTELPIKMSVSELVKNSEITLVKPDFIKGGKATASEKGSAMHRFSQHRDIELARKDLDSEILRLENHKLVSAALLNKKALKNFINSPVADRILKSEKVYREKDFVVTYNAGEALKDSLYADDEIMIQGVMDCVLENGDEITVIDYKTDNVADMATLFKRYESQLEYYRYAAKQIFRKENVKCLLYSFRLNEYIEF